MATSTELGSFLDKKSCLQNQVKDLIFVDKPFQISGYKCCSCQHVAIDHQTANCGDVFCSHCYTKNHGKPCSTCQRIVTTSTLDLEFEGAVFDLKVECKFKKDGCHLIVKLRDFLSHAKLCKFGTKNLLPTSEKDGPTAEAHQKLIDEVTNLKQAYELAKVEIHGMATMFKELSEAYKIMEVEMLKLKDAQLFAELRTRPEVPSFRPLKLEHIPVNLIEDSPNVFCWRIGAIQKQLVEIAGEQKYMYIIESEAYGCISNGYKFKMMLEEDSSFLHISLEFSEDLINDGQASTPFLHSRRFILMDQSDALVKINLELLDRPGFGMKSTEDITMPIFHDTRFFPVSLLENENRYLHNGHIMILILIEPITLLTKQLASNDGVLLWRIENYSKKKKAEVDGVQRCLVSRPFQTSAKGYLFHAELYLNGFRDAEGQHLSIYTRALASENDAFLAPSFKYKSTFHLLDQSDSEEKKNIFYRTSHEMYRGRSSWGFRTFVRQNLVETLTYLKDDSLLFKVVVEIG